MKKVSMLVICIALVLVLSGCDTILRTVFRPVIMSFDNEYETTDINEYLQLNISGLSKLMIFPENFDKISKVNKYYHYWYSVPFANEVEIYFDVCYDETEFYEEIERIENLTYRIEDSHTPKTVIKDDKSLFHYSTYIAVFNVGSYYEYVCIDEENYRMIYVALDGISLEKNSIDEIYLPKNYENIISSENDNQSFSYNMYHTEKAKDEDR